MANSVARITLGTLVLVAATAGAAGAAQPAAALAALSDAISRKRSGGWRQASCCWRFSSSWVDAWPHET